jgi:hypothetical protein
MADDNARTEQIKSEVDKLLQSNNAQKALSVSLTAPFTAQEPAKVCIPFFAYSSKCLVTRLLFL